MRIHAFFCALALPVFSLSGVQEQPKNVTVQAPNLYPIPEEKKNPDEKEEDIADRDSNRYEYNLYDRQQNEIDENRRDQQLRQQYYYQQSAGQNDSGTQYNRTRQKSSQFFNPIGDD